MGRKWHAARIAQCASAQTVPVTVHYATVDGTAVAGTDYDATSGTLQFGPFTLTQLVPVTILPNPASTGVKTFQVNLSNSTGAPIARAAATGTINAPVTLANSAALLRFPESVGDWVRPGIMLYGASPFPALQSAADIGLRPAMTLKSALIGVQTLRAGDRVGYGGTFAADHDMRIGVVACGYGDGYPRQAPTGTPILVGGRRTRTVGRVSMDKICVDLDGIPGAAIGTPVTLWGEGLPADEVASAAGTVAYELFCALAGRVPVSTR
jgi:alanine racemase